jgi:hypothetical protein
MRGFFRTLMAMAMLSATSSALAEPYTPQIGQCHPDFTLPDIWTGRQISLSDFLGKKVLLIHFASW